MNPRRSILIIVLIAAILFSSCRKNIGRTYTIQGRLVESSSNPIPVSNYRIAFYQATDRALLSSSLGLDTNGITGNDGKIKFLYNWGNGNDIFIQGTDTTKYKGLHPEWNTVPARTDIDLKTLYLFKKIDTFVRKVQFNTTLNAGETLEVITSDSSGASYKTLSGPIASGTLFTVDTILNCKLSIFDILTQQYILEASLKRTSYQQNFNVTLTQGDEPYREILMTY